MVERFWMLKKIVGCLLVTMIFLYGCEQPKEEPSAKKTVKPGVEGTIIALGDSLTAGLGVDLEKSYPALLQQKLKEDGYHFRVVNGGVSGETTSGTLSRLDWMLGQNPDIVILETGANDGLRGIDISLIDKNLRDIILKLQTREVITVLAGMKMVQNMGEDYSGKFNMVYSDIAHDTGAIYMPFFLEGVATVPDLNSVDGIHPNEEGYRRIVANLYPYVQTAIKTFRKKRNSQVPE